MSENKRLHQRYDHQLRVTLVVGSQEREVVTRNLSLGGVFVLMNNAPAIGHQVRLKVQLPALDEELDLKATVIWRSAEGAGLRFDVLRAKEVWALNQLFDE